METRLQDHLDQWEPVISSLVAADRGDPVADQALDLVLASLGQHADWQQLVAVLRRIRAGERDPALARRIPVIVATPEVFGSCDGWQGSAGFGAANGKA
ncbi:MAG: hypothetical protein JOZ09_16955 [Pseudonocardiales bacterium]|nr:hypothetical protein [Pseudonocardiales bacterium]